VSEAFDPLEPLPLGATLDLGAIDAAGDPGADKDALQEQTAEDGAAIAELAWRLHAEETRALLVILQGMDASGKDGILDTVFGAVNPVVLAVRPFGPPSDEERAHDYLWRIHAACPRRGRVGVFNRSQYEDVGVVRVHDWAPGVHWPDRFRQISDFERTLSENGTTVVKLFLHISRDGQKEQLQERLDDPEKHWKFRAGDLDERARWDDYATAYGEALAATSTAWAPWHVVPMDRRWYGRAVAARIVRRTLERLDPQFPPLAPDAVGLRVE